MTTMHTPKGALEICNEVYVRQLMIYDDIVMSLHEDLVGEDTLSKRFHADLSYTTSAALGGRA